MPSVGDIGYEKFMAFAEINFIQIKLESQMWLFDFDCPLYTIPSCRLEQLKCIVFVQS